MTYRGRFAPSPTGPAHLGTARTALIGWLRARSVGGAFVLRMEDLDAPRVVEGAAEAMLADLRWLGLDWDEGPDVGGPYGPYTQSERLARYGEVLAALLPHTFECTCSRKEIAAIASAPHGGETIYPGTCRDGPTHPERDAATRFRMPDPPPAFDDVVLGRVEGQGRGDFVVHRKDGVFAYQLACVVDDHDERITEVLRGDDLVSSTPRQIALYEALGWPVPAFAHVPLVYGPDGERLAKRHGAIALAQLRDDGRSPESIVGEMAYALGLIDRAEPVAAADLVEGFALEALSSRAAPEPGARA